MGDRHLKPLDVSDQIGGNGSSIRWKTIVTHEVLESQMEANIGLPKGCLKLTPELSEKNTERTHEAIGIWLHFPNLHPILQTGDVVERNHLK